MFIWVNDSHLESDQLIARVTYAYLIILGDQIILVPQSCQVYLLLHPALADLANLDLR